jgi:ribosomal protein S18 acetylase RimI-like enzyme
MRWFEDTPYNEAFLSELDKESFPLTFDMCNKNDYTQGNKVVRQFINQEIPYPLAIIIWEEVAPKEIRIYSLEVHSKYRFQDYGRHILTKFKEVYKLISLCSLPDAKIFYEKMGFVEQEENQMIWRKPK